MPWHIALALIASGQSSYFAVLVNLSGLAESIGLNQIVIASGIYLAGAFVLAVALARFSPRGWLGRQFRKYLWLIPFSPLVIVCAVIWLLLKQVAAVLDFAAMSFRWLFGKAPGQQALSAPAAPFEILLQEQQDPSQALSWKGAAALHAKLA